MANLVVFWAKNDVFLEILAVFKTYLQNLALDIPNSFTNVSPWLVEQVTEGYRPKINFHCNTYNSFKANFKNFIKISQNSYKILTKFEKMWLFPMPKVFSSQWLARTLGSLELDMLGNFKNWFFGSFPVNFITDT